MCLAVRHFSLVVAMSVTLPFLPVFFLLWITLEWLVLFLCMTVAMPVLYLTCIFPVLVLQYLQVQKFTTFRPYCSIPLGLFLHVFAYFPLVWDFCISGLHIGLFTFPFLGLILLLSHLHPGFIAPRFWLRLGSLGIFGRHCGMLFRVFYVLFGRFFRLFFETWPLWIGLLFIGNFAQVKDPTALAETIGPDGGCIFAAPPPQLVQHIALCPFVFCH